LRAQLCSLDGRQSFTAEGRAEVSNLQEAVALGSKIGHALKQKTPDDVLAEILE